MGIKAESAQEQEREKIILGIDPGRDKIGFAFAELNSRDLILSGIFYFAELENFINKLNNFKNLSNLKEDFCEWQRENFIEKFKLNLNKNFELIIALGDGTKSREFKIYLENNLKNKNKIIVVNEAGSTLEARDLYWQLHEPGLLKSLLPRGMRVPARILDDLAAWAVARRAVI